MNKIFNNLDRLFLTFSKVLSKFYKLLKTTKLKVFQICFAKFDELV